MGNGTKVALVALLIVMVVVVAKFVNTAGDNGNRAAAGGGAGSGENATPTADPSTAGAKLVTQNPANTQASANKGTTQARPEANPRGGAARSTGGSTSTRPFSASSNTSSNPRSSGLPNPIVGERDPRQPLSRVSERPTPATTTSAGTLAARAAGANDTTAATRTDTGPTSTEPLVRTTLPTTSGASSEASDPTSLSNLSNPTPPESRPLTEKRAAELDEYERIKKEREQALAMNVGSQATSRAPIPTPEELGVSKFSADPISSAGRSSTGSVTSPTSMASRTPTASTRSDDRSRSASTGGKAGVLAVHEIEVGDSYWVLAKKYYGDGRLHPAIQKANAEIRFHPGNKVSIPSLTDAEREAVLGSLESAGSSEGRSTTTSADAPRRESGARSASSQPASPPASDKKGEVYKVKKGDTLTGIAKRFYGDATKWPLIEDANEDVRFLGLQAGMEIVIPTAK